MAPSSAQDPHRTVYERAPVWLAHLKSINDTVERRKCKASDALHTPELSFQTNTVDNSGLETTGTPPPLQTVLSSSVNKRLSKADNTSAIATKSFLTTPHSHMELRRQHSHTSLIVDYDAESQGLLSDIVKDVEKLLYANTKVSFHPLPVEHVDRLRKASKLCEDAAFQLLRDGQCQPYSTAAAKVFHEVFMASWKEVMKDQLPAKTRVASEAAVETQPPPAKRARIPAIQLAELEASGVDVDDDDSENDIALPPLRLTSGSRLLAPR